MGKPSTMVDTDRVANRSSPQLTTLFQSRPAAIFLPGLVAALGLVGVPSCISAPKNGKEAPLTCVWEKGADGELVGAFLRGWADRNGVGKLEGWDVNMQPRNALVTLRTSHSNGVYLLTLSASCATPPKVETVTFQGPRPVGAAALEKMAKDFPAPKKQLATEVSRFVENCRVRHRTASIQACNPESWTFLLLAVLLVLLAWLADDAPKRYQRVALVLTVVGVLALVSYSVAPLFTIPFANDAPLLRAAFAQESISGDWNHSFLPYLLNRPATWFSMEPWALRVVPFSWLLIETTLLVVIARREGGLAAGALAGVWFASEVRRRQGIVELTDWDLAGVFLLALVLWTMRPRSEPPQTSRPLIWLGVLMTAAFLGSYLMIVPVTVLTGLLWLDPEYRKRFAPVATMVWALLTVRALSVFISGQGVEPVSFGFHEFARLMFAETPVHRSRWMIPPVLCGLVWLVWGWRHLSRCFIGVSIAAIVLATIFAWHFSHVNQGYYISPTTPLVLLASAAAVGVGAQRLRAWAGSLLGSVFGRAVMGLALAGLTLFTVSLWDPPEPARLAPNGLSNMAAFDRILRKDRLPVVTDTYHFGLYLGYERIRRGVSPFGPLLPPGPLDLVGRTRLLNHRTCRVHLGWDSLRSFYLVREDKDLQRKRCGVPSRFHCKLLFKRKAWLNYFRCTPVVRVIPK